MEAVVRIMYIRKNYITVQRKTLVGYTTHNLKKDNLKEFKLFDLIAVDLKAEQYKKEKQQ